MTSSARHANIASLVAIAVLTLTAFTAGDWSFTEEASGRTVAATGYPPGGGPEGGAADGGVEAAETAGLVTTSDDTSTSAGVSGQAVEADRPPIVIEDLDAGRRGLDALASIDYRWEELLPGWQIRFQAAASGAYGYTLPEEHRIEIYVRGDQSDDLLAHVVAHELGHAIDVTFNTSEDRQAWRDARGLGDEPWWPDDRAADFATGAGDFAESFAASMLGPASFRSELGEPPDAAQLQLLEVLSRS